MSIPILLATAIAKKKKSKFIKTVLVAKAISKKKKVVKSKAICCLLASKTKNKAAIEKVMKLRTKAKQMKNVLSKVEKGVSAYKNDRKKQAAGYFLEASLIGIRTCASDRR